MPEAKPAPGGIVVLAGLHIVVGASMTVGFTGFVLMGAYVDIVRGGVPADLILIVGAFLFLGVGVGTGLLRGSPWAWYVASTAYSVGFVGSCLALVRAFLGLAGPAGQAMVPVDRLLAGGMLGMGAALALLLGIPLWLYLLSSGARGHFGLGGLAIWKPIAVQAALGAVLASGVIASDLRSRSAENVTRLQAIGHRGPRDEAEVRFLIGRLERGTTLERISAAWALGQSGTAAAAGALARAAREDDDADVRINAVAALSALDGDDLVDLLPTFLDDESEQVRAAALREMGHERFRDSAPDVGAVLLEGPPSLHALAADVLTRIGGEQAASYLARAAADPDPDVRSRVAFGLGRLRAHDASPILLRMLEDESWEVRANAVQALGWLGDSETRPALRERLDDPHEQVRGAAERALAAPR